MAIRSIRKRLVLWLLVGLGALWGSAGAGLYFSVRKSELARLDARLENLSGGVRFYGSMMAREAVREAAWAEFTGPPRPPQLDRPGEADTDAPERGGQQGRPAPRRDGGDRDPGRNRRDGEERERPGADPENRGPQTFQVDSREYFQIWPRGDLDISTQRSPSLGEMELEQRVGGTRAKPTFFDTSLPDGTRLRAMSFNFRPFGWGRGRSRPPDPRWRETSMDAVVALDAEPLNATLGNLLLGIVGVGFLAALASVGLVHFALKDGLRPLHQLGDRLAEIDADSLGARFSYKTMPTELAPIYDRLNALMGRLEKSFERERRFSSDLAHELRTPVAELQTMAEVALKWPDGADREQSEQTLEIAQQMGGIIESLLALGRFENGQAEIEPESVDLGGLVTECWRPFADTAAGRGLRVDFELPEGKCLETDPKMLRLIVSNLLSNAAEYTAEGGQISIVAEEGCLTVSNDAPDILPAQVPHLFERFWRADGSRTDGTHCGLGLSLARACARVLSLDFEARHEAPGKLVFTLRGKSSEKLRASSSDNLASVG